MIPMSYGAPAQILSVGSYKGYTYAIVSYKTYPCAYVNVGGFHSDGNSGVCTHFLKNMDYFDVNEQGLVEVPHGGFTYSKDFLKYDKIGLDFMDTNDWWLGWDYCHLGDRSRHDTTGKAWTTEEIYEEVIRTIESLEAANLRFWKERS